MARSRSSAHLTPVSSSGKSHGWGRQLATSHPDHARVGNGIATPFHDPLLETRMPTIRQLIQTSPAKANELFAKLVETSPNAVKTRERLFADLKEELEPQMRLEEQHLFPVL